MVQGAVKKSSKPASSKKNSVLGPKRGARVIAPKKKKLIQQKNIIKKHSAGMTALTEKHLAERAGHLELLKGGKRSAKEEGKRGKK